MKKDQKIRISQCMIVKDEEKNIRQALSWGKDIMWEQIVVDTGSTDRTVEIAQSMGAKVYHFPWIDDFSAAKNYAIEQAAGDWIAFLDADEYMLKEDTSRVLSVLGRAQTKGCLEVVTGWLHLGDGGTVILLATQTRFFRRMQGVRYQGRIHEFLSKQGQVLGGAESLDASRELTIQHTGYAPSEMEAKQKIRRNEILIQKELENSPNDCNMLGYLGDAYICEKKYEEAIFWYQKAVQALPPVSTWTQWPMEDARTPLTFVQLLRLLCGLKKEDDLIQKTYETAAAYIPWEPDFDFTVGEYYVEKGDYSSGARHLEKAISLYENRPRPHYGVRMSTDLMGAWEKLAVCYFNSRDYKKCVNCCVSLLKANRFHMGILKVLLGVFQEDMRRYEQELAVSYPAPVPAANGRQVADFLGKLYYLTDLKDRMFVLKAAKEQQYTELLPFLRSYFSLEELAILDGMADGAAQTDAES